MQAQDRWLPRAGEVSYRCIRCGFCLPSCPTFRLTGLETEGPRGRIALVRAAAEGRLPLGEAVPHLERCLGCRACEAACPVGVPYGQLLEGARAAARRLAVTALPERLLRAAMGQAVASPGRLRAVAWAWWVAQRTGLAARLAGWVGMAAPRSLWRQRAAALADTVLALPAARPPWQLWAQARSRGDGAAGVALFAGCIQELFFSPVNRAAARVLAALGYPVRTLVGGGCCGAVHAHLGMPEVAARLARRNIEAFERSGARWLVVAAGGCYAFLREYPLHVACGAGRRAGREEPERLWVQRAERFRERVREFSEFVEQQQLPALQPPAAEPITVSYQDSCHLRHVARLQQAPRRLLARIPGVRLKELPGADTCCGAGGAYWLTEPGMSLALMREKMGQVARVGADVLVVSNPPCQLQLLRAARQGAGAWRVLHIAELLARALPGVEPERGE